MFASVNCTIIGSDDCLSPKRRQAIILTNVGLLLIELLGKFNEILIEIYTFSFKAIHLKMSSGKWRPQWKCCYANYTLPDLVLIVPKDAFYITVTIVSHNPCVYLNVFGCRQRYAIQTWYDSDETGKGIARSHSGWYNKKAETKQLL